MAEEIYSERWCEFCNRTGFFADSSFDVTDKNTFYFYCPLCERGCLSDETEGRGCLFDEGHDSLEDDELEEEFSPDMLFGEDLLH